MMCHRMGRSPTGTIGLGRNSVSSRKRVPFPPQRITTFIIRTQRRAGGVYQRRGCESSVANGTDLRVHDGRQSLELRQGHAHDLVHVVVTVGGEPADET